MYVKVYEQFMDDHPQLLLEAMTSMGTPPPSELMNKAVAACAAARDKNREASDHAKDPMAVISFTLCGD